MDTDKPAGTQPTQGATDASAGQAGGFRLQVDASGAGANYANICLVMPGTQEVVLNFAMLAGPQARPGGSVKVNNCVVLNYYSTKQLMLDLRRAVERYESMYGVLEMDPRKRLTPAAQEMLAQQQSAARADNLGTPTPSDNPGGGGIDENQSN